MATATIPEPMDTTQQSIGTQPGVSSAFHCASCGTGLSSLAQFCPSCGAQARPSVTVQSRGRSSFPVAPGATARTLLYIIAAVCLTALATSIPGIGFVLYPFKLFATFVHEFSHAAVGVLTGGQVTTLEINPDGSGLTLISGGATLLIASAGYIGTSVAGAALLLTPVRYSRAVLTTLTACTLGALLLFHPDVQTMGWGVLFAAVLGAVAWKGTPWLQRLSHQFLAVQLALNAILDLWTLDLYSADSRGYSDAVLASRAFPLPSIVWAGLWSLCTVGLFLFSLYRLLQRRAGNEHRKRLSRTA